MTKQTKMDVSEVPGFKPSPLRMAGRLFKQAAERQETLALKHGGRPDPENCYQLVLEDWRKDYEMGHHDTDELVQLLTEACKWLIYYGAFWESLEMEERVAADK